MSALKNMCEALGFHQVKTYIASGNVLFQSELDAVSCKRLLEQRLCSFAGKSVAVFIRTPQELDSLLIQNPFRQEAGNRTVTTLLDQDLNEEDLKGARHQAQEQIALGERAVYIFYGEGMANSKLVVPAAKHGTARNINTLSKLRDMAFALAAQ